MDLTFLDAVFLFAAGSFIFIICNVAQRRATYDPIEEQHSSTKYCKKLRTPELTILFAFIIVFCIYFLLRSSQLSNNQLSKNHPAASRTFLAPGNEWRAENNGVYWDFNCDWDNHDLFQVTISPSLCGPTCVAHSNCTHFTASDGMCYLKSTTTPLTAIPTTGATVCGWVQREDNAGVGRVYYSVKTTCHQATEVGSCRLPREAYSLHTPVALGDIPELQDLRFQGSLCGHILKVDCGHGAISVIVTNSNPGGGLDLYKSSWDTATASAPPGELQCSVQFTLKNPLQTGGYRCYTSGEPNNEYYHNVGLLNTEGRIVNGAMLKGVKGTPSNSDGYYTFTNQANKDDEIWFNFTDGGSYSVALKDCAKGGNYELWS